RVSRGLGGVTVFCSATSRRKRRACAVTQYRFGAEVYERRSLRERRTEQLRNKDNQFTPIGAIIGVTRLTLYLARRATKGAPWIYCGLAPIQSPVVDAVLGYSEVVGRRLRILRLEFIRVLHNGELKVRVTRSASSYRVLPAHAAYQTSGRLG